MPTHFYAKAPASMAAVRQAEIKKCYSESKISIAGTGTGIMPGKTWQPESGEMRYLPLDALCCWGGGGS